MTAAGNDVLAGGTADDLILGDNTNYEATATSGTVGGHDVLSGAGGDDVLLAGPAADVLDGGAKADDCNGEGGRDVARNCETLTAVP